MNRLSGLLISGLLIAGGIIGCTFTTMEVEVGPISIADSEIVAGEAFTVEANVTNIGEDDGTFTASIRLDEKVVDRKKVWIAAGTTEIAQFDCIAETPGTHTLKLKDSSATFTALKPADFEVTLPSIPTEAYTRQATVIQANVTNTGEVEGIYNGRLMVDGIEKASSDTPIAPGATETISFTMTIDTPGTYTISLDGVTATLTVFLAFPDANLEAVVRETINKLEGPIYISDLETITALAAQEKGISDITGLEYCVNLQLLVLHNNNISNISPLAGLINLRELVLWGNNISDISPLAGLTNLQALDLSGNNISNFSQLVDLTDLHDLHLAGNSISDISPITSLTNLQRLWLHGNNISDLSSLAGLNILRVLNLNGNNISDISPLAGLTNLQELELAQNNISDLSSLASLTNLQHLELESNNISDLSPLADLTDLHVLRLQGNNVIDLSPLADLNNLQELWLAMNNISDISPLADLTDLQYLDLRENNVSDLSPLAGLTNLQYLELQANNISDISPLVENSGLSVGDTVDLRSNPLNSISLNDYIPQLDARGIDVEW